MDVDAAVPPFGETIVSSSGPAVGEALVALPRIWIPNVCIPPRFWLALTGTKTIMCAARLPPVFVAFALIVTPALRRIRCGRV